MKTIFDGKQAEIYERASELLKDTPAAPQLAKLFIAVNLIDTLTVKPADLLVGTGFNVESGLPDDSIEQKRLNSIIEENDIRQLTHELVIGAGIRGDAWVKTYYANRDDMSEAIALGLSVDQTIISPEPVIEAVDASQVFPEFSRGSKKRLKAVNIAWIECVKTNSSVISAVLSGSKEQETAFLNVERHLPGYIVYERYKLESKGVDSTYGVPIPVFTIEEKVATGRENDVVETGIAKILVQHIPYKSVDTEFYGIGNIEKLESVLAAINDRLVAIDFILMKHSDPTAYGPDLEEGDAVRWGGKYIPVRKDEQTPGYAVWDGKLEGAFKELDYLLSIVFQMAETPQWLFGTNITQDRGGTGTSHSDGRAVYLRMMPIISKVERIRVHIDKALRTALWLAQELEVFANEGVEGFDTYTPVYPVIKWQNPLPKDAKEEAEIANIRTGGKPTLDVHSAVKRLDNVDDIQAKEIIARIDGDEVRTSGTVDASIFNATDGVT